jgi:hypothetical protein
MRCYAADSQEVDMGQQLGGKEGLTLYLQNTLHKTENPAVVHVEDGEEMKRDSKSMESTALAGGT